jgi:hypothetical protein
MEDCSSLSPRVWCGVQVDANLDCVLYVSSPLGRRRHVSNEIMPCDCSLEIVFDLNVIISILQMKRYVIVGKKKQF